jgi:hypothetical protein
MEKVKQKYVFNLSALNNLTLKCIEYKFKIITKLSECEKNKVISYIDRINIKTYFIY